MPAATAGSDLAGDRDGPAAVISIRLPRRQDRVNVGYRLYREVRDFAPADLTSSELVVAWVIADDANDDTRISWITNAELCLKARLKPSSVRAALAKLAAGGYEFRVIHGYGKDNRPVFAAKGHSTDYRVPDFRKGASLLAPMPVAFGSIGASGPAPIDASKALEIASKALEIAPKGASRLAPLPSDPLTIPSNINGSDLTPTVEGARARGEVNGVDLSAAVGDSPRRLTQAEEFERQANGLREFEKAQAIRGAGTS